MCELKQDITHYNYVSQGKTTIPGVDDAEELLLTDVCCPFRSCFLFYLAVKVRAPTGTMLAASTVFARLSCSLEGP